MPQPIRLKLTIRGAVQGVGFRPFVYRLATELALTGWVSNSAQGVYLEVEGPRPAVEQFLLRLDGEKPPQSSIQSLEPSWLDPAGHSQFEIRPSEAGGARTALILPDLATCAACRDEIFAPSNRRYFYPFTNCTHCGPRFSIIESLPYDRANTSMRTFEMCPQCRAEFENPRDRRFHAQPNACPACGPRLALWDAQGQTVVGDGGDAGSSFKIVLEGAAAAIREGKIVAAKGLGGFHLLVAAHSESAVRHLRQRKRREEKPFAVMFPSLAAIKNHCEVSPMEERLLCSAEAPIVLLHRRPPARTEPALAESIAPANPSLGAMLPYTPLHHLLLSLLNFPVVATSGNLSDEPICIDEREALERLGGVAELFLVHNRPIVRHVDDSVARFVAGRELILRRARGYAPLPLPAPEAPGAELPVLAVGAHLKNSVALCGFRQVFLSQHIGDLETEQSYEAFRRIIADFQRLYQLQPAIVVADEHPDYRSTQFARRLAAAGPGAESGKANSPPRLLQVQHHLAHVLSCMAENELAPPVLGVAWDGTGYGLDGSIWGGEFFLIQEEHWERCAHFRQFRLPGGEKAIKEPCRTAMGLLYAAFGREILTWSHLPPLQAFDARQLGVLRQMLERPLNAPLTSSAGRLFDAVASLAGLRQFTRFEGQAAMELEFALADVRAEESYPLALVREGQSPVILDWLPLLRVLLKDLKGHVTAPLLSLRFHNALVEAIVAVARHFGQQRVVLSGGCFQNRYLTERAITRLQAEGFRPYWHQRVPPNDGGIALGQVLAATSPNWIKPKR